MANPMLEITPIFPENTHRCMWTTVCVANPMPEITSIFPEYTLRCMWMTECGKPHARDYSNISRVYPPVYVDDRVWQTPCQRLLQYFQSLPTGVCGRQCVANPMPEITPIFPEYTHRCMWMTECGKPHARDYSNISRVCPPVYVDDRVWQTPC